MTLRSSLFWSVLLLLSGMIDSEAEARPRRACRLWHCGVGPYTCMDTLHCQPICPPLCPPMQFQDVECQVLVPQTHYETRKIWVTQYTQEMREQVVVTHRHVPREVVHQVNRVVCDPVVREREVPVVRYRPVWEEKLVNYHYCEPVYEQHEAKRVVYDPVWEDIQRPYTVMVPRQEWHVGQRMVCRMEPVQTTRPVWVDRGHWADVVVGTAPVCLPCGPGGPCHFACRPITCRVWKPCLVTEHVPCTTFRPVQVPVEFRYCTTRWEPQQHVAVQRVCRMQPREVPFQYTTCRMVPRVGQRTIQVCRQVMETDVRVEQYTEWVSRVVPQEVRSIVYDCVPEERKIQVPVCVPVQVEREIQVPVCRLVPQTVVKRVLVPGAGPL